MAHFTLTGLEPLSCLGTSFPSLEAAYNYALSLRVYGLCEEFCIGEYQETGHVGVFDSRKDKFEPTNQANWVKEGF